MTQHVFIHACSSWNVSLKSFHLFSLNLTPPAVIVQLCLKEMTQGLGEENIDRFSFPIIKKVLALLIYWCIRQAINYPGQIEITRLRCLRHEVVVVLDRLHAEAVKDETIVTWQPVGNVPLQLSDLFASQSPFLVVIKRTTHPSASVLQEKKSFNRHHARIFL